MSGDAQDADVEPGGRAGGGGEVTDEAFQASYELGLSTRSFALREEPSGD